MYFNIDKKVKALTNDLNSKIEAASDEKYSVQTTGFFKTGENSYSASDHFMGIRVPVLRKMSKEFVKTLERDNIEFKKTEQILKVLLFSKWHEKRLFSLVTMTDIFTKNLKKIKKYIKKSQENKSRAFNLSELEGLECYTICQAVYNMYFNYMVQVNNWDLVDLSASYISGAWLYEKSLFTHENKCIWYSDFDVLNTLAGSINMWERRISIISTHYFIKNGYTEKTFEIAGLLLGDKEDLIHKATGWMLREAGKKDMPALKDFLRVNYKNIPRTCLRYAIEKFEETERKQWLNQNIS